MAHRQIVRLQGLEEKSQPGNAADAADAAAAGASVTLGIQTGWLCSWTVTGLLNCAIDVCAYRQTHVVVEISELFGR